MTTTGASAASTTGIGSLPHHNVDAALEIAFRTGIPYLPQIPIRNPWEFMIPQSLEGIPGLQAERDGSVSLDFDIWASRAHAYGLRLADAFSAPASNQAAFEAFEPSSATSSSWSPFLWECTERSAPRAKIQLAGPLTCQWALKVTQRGGLPRPHDPDLGAQLYRHVWARAVAMIRRLKSAGVAPLLFLDEPALYALNVGRSSGSAQAGTAEAVGILELGLLIRALKREGAEIGIHCCSNAAWDALLGLEPDYLSIDVSASLDHLLANGQRLEAFALRGGRLALGVIPTSSSPPVGDLWTAMRESFERARLAPGVVAQILGAALFTPACGFAMQSTSEADAAFDALAEFHELVRNHVQGGAGNGKGHA